MSSVACRFQQLVVLFTRGLRDQQAAVAGGAVQESPFVWILRLVLSADRIVGTQFGHPQRISHVLVNLAAHLDQAAQDG